MQWLRSEVQGRELKQRRRLERKEQVVARAGEHSTGLISPLVAEARAKGDTEILSLGS